MLDLRNTKVMVRDSKKTQKYLFDNGCVWNFGGNKYIPNQDILYIYVDDNAKMSFGVSHETFAASSNRKITVPDVFTRDMLQCGMLIEVSGGRIGTVLLGTKHGDIVAGDGVWFPVKRIFDEDGCIGDDEEYCIKIVQPESNRGYADKFGTVIWEQPSEEMTIEEISEALGKRVKVVCK
jgi:hypothetical protein